MNIGGWFKNPEISSEYFNIGGIFKYRLGYSNIPLQSIADIVNKLYTAIATASDSVFDWTIVRHSPS